MEYELDGNLLRFEACRVPIRNDIRTAVSKDDGIVVCLVVPPGEMDNSNVIGVEIGSGK